MFFFILDSNQLLEIVGSDEMVNDLSNDYRTENEFPSWFNWFWIGSLSQN